jgi:hypothetical protein
MSHFPVKRSYRNALERWANKLHIKRVGDTYVSQLRLGTPHIKEVIEFAIRRSYILPPDLFVLG